MTVGVTREAGGVGQSAPSIDWPTRLWRRRGLLFGLLMSLSISALGTGWIPYGPERVCPSGVERHGLATTERITLAGHRPW